MDYFSFDLLTAFMTKTRLRSAWILAFCLIIPALLQAQISDRLNRPIPTPEMPNWAKMLYADSINVHQLDAEFAAWRLSHPDVKTNFTKYYSRWRHQIARYVQPDGTLKALTPDELEAQYRPSRGNAAVGTEQSQASDIWKPIIMNTFSPSSGATVPWQSNIYAFAVSKSNPNILVVGTEPGGIFKTTNKGQDWFEIGKDYVLGTEAIAIHPSDPNIIILGANPTLRMTTDGGTTWNTVFTTAGMQAYRIEFVAANPKIILASTSVGLFRTTDGGKTWATIFATGSSDVVIHSTNPALIYALQLNASQHRYEFWKSVDTGATFDIRKTGWYADTSDAGGRMTVTQADPRRIYCVLLSNKGPQVLRSDDEGESWSVTATGSSATVKSTVMPMNNGQGYYDFAMLASPTNPDDLIVGTQSTVKSTDGGKTFVALGGYAGPHPIHPDLQDMHLAGGETWISTDGGITKSTDFFSDTKNEVALMKGIGGSDFWGFDQSWTGDVMVGGRYHNGNTAYSEKYNGKFMSMGGGEASTGYVNPIRSNWTYFSDIGGYILPDTFSNVFTSIPIAKWPNESYFEMWYSGMHWDPRCYNTVWIGSGRTLWRSTNGGAKYDSVFSAGDSITQVQSIEIARSNPNVMYITVHETNHYDARVWRSSNAGKSWDTLPRFAGTSGSERRQMQITLSATDENELWAALNTGASGNKVFHTTNGGKTWDNYTTTTIKDVTPTYIVHQQGTDGGVYLATTGGQVYYRNHTLSDWQQYLTGLPVSEWTRALKPFYRDGKIRAGSNLGIWEAPLYEASKPIAQPTVDKRVTECSRDTFFFADYSALKHDGATWSWDFPGAKYVSSTTEQNPRVVYSETGKFPVTLTVTNTAGTSTKTIPDMIEVKSNECGIDSFPRFALDLSNTNDLATLSPVPALAGDTGFTVSMWVKLNGKQGSFSQLLSSWSSNIGFSFGFAFEGYARNSNLTFYWTGVPYQLTSPFDLDTLVWNHVAITIRPDTVTLYANGVPWKYAGNFRNFDLSKTPFELGGGLPGQGGNFTGQIAEVKIYDHALTTEEIRSKMHLIYPSGEPGLVSYYQFDEPTSERFYDRVGALHASNSGGTRVAATAPIATGTSTIRTVAKSGEYDFTEAQLKIRYGAGGAIPNGEVAAYRLNTRPDSVSNGVLPLMKKLSGSYWIVRNWGKTGNLLDTLILSTVGSISAADSLDEANSLVLFHRVANEHQNKWKAMTHGGLQQFASGFRTVGFELADSGSDVGQYIFGTKGSSPLAVRSLADLSRGMTVVPNPASGIVTIRITPDANESACHIEICDMLGRVRLMKDISVVGGALSDGALSAQLDLGTLEAGAYLVRAGNRSVMVKKE